MATSTVKLPRISGRDRVVQYGANKWALQSKGRRKYKTPLKTRKRISAGLRRVKIPALTTGALILGLWEPIKILRNTGNWGWAAREFVANYTGFWILKGQTNWKFSRMYDGLLPLLGVMLLNRSGLLKPVNQKLAKTRIPLRLN